MQAPRVIACCALCWAGRQVGRQAGRKAGHLMQQTYVQKARRGAHSLTITRKRKQTKTNTSRQAGRQADRLRVRLRSARCVGQPGEKAVRLCA